MTRSRTWALWLSLAALPVAPAFAAPEGEQVVTGEAAFTRDGDLTQITTYTPQTIVNYTSFDIGVHETVSIDQPDAASRILNNVLSTDPTSIQGRLFSNGQVWIVNPVGVFFGDRAIVDVGSLVAGAGRVADEDFLAGVEHLSDVAGRVEVASGAQIRAADSVLLVGASVANYGNISAADGMIALVAGGEVRLARIDGRVVITADRAVTPDPERWAVAQAGTLDAGSVSLTAADAYSLAMNHSGITRAREIHVEGGDGLVSVAGALDASSAAAGQSGGRIAVLGDRVLVGAATLDASGEAGGGEILVGGDYRGGGEVRTASRTFVSPDAVLRADAQSHGDGGRIIVWADDATRFYGALSARGGSEGGDGGFAEISGAQSLDSRGAIDLGADAGRAGTLLYDPKDIVVHAGAFDGSDAPDTSDAVLSAASLGQVLFGTPDELATPFDVYESELESTNANIVLQATNSISSTDSFAVQIIDGNSLTLLTRNNTGDETDTSFLPGIHLAGVSFQTGGTGGITLATGNDAAGGGGSGASARIEVGNLTTAGGVVSVSSKDGAITVGNVTTTASVAGGSGGFVALTTGDGDIAVGTITARGADGAAGGAGGAIALAAGGTGSVNAGGIDAAGGVGTAGAGGAGGDVGIRSIAGAITVAGINVSGGTGAGGGIGGNGGTISVVADLEPDSAAPVETGAIPPRITVNGNLIARGGDNLSGGTADTGADGGAGGQILVSAGLVADGGSIALGQIGRVQLNASAGSGTGGGGNAATGGTSAFSGATIGAIRIEAHGDVTANADFTADGGNTTAGGAGGAGGNGGDISVVSDRANVLLAGNLISQGGDDNTPSTTNDGTGGTAIVRGHGVIDVSLEDTTRLDRFEVIETEVTGAVDVTGGGITAQGAGAPDSTIHTITNIVTADDAPHFTYRLADPLVTTGPEGDVEQIDVTTLAVANGAVVLGANGGKLANARVAATDPDEEVLLGRIQSAGAGTHVTTAGPLEVFATNIGDLTPLRVDGAGTDPSLELTVAGDVRTVAGDAGLVVGAAMPIVDLTQRSAAGDVKIDLPGGGLVDVDIEGEVVDTGASRIETAEIRHVDTTGGTGTAFFFHLADATASSDETSRGEPVLRIARGAVDLGADAGFSTTGDLYLQLLDADEDMNPMDPGAAIDANGHTVVLIADANGADAGAIVASQRGADDIAGAGALVALAGSGVGSADMPLRTSSTSDLELAGRTASGAFQLVHTGAGNLVVSPLATDADPEELDDVATGGVQAGGDVVIVLNNTAAKIEFGGMQPTGATELVPHVVSGGGQRYAGAVLVASDEVRLRAGGDGRFDGAIDADGVAARALDVSAGGTTTFAGDIGASAPLDALTVTDARFEGDRNATVVSRGDFGAIDGPGSLVLRGTGTGSQLVFRDNVGGRGALGAFATDADLLVFGSRSVGGVLVSSADRIVAGSVQLNNDPATADNTSDVATIADTSGGLVIESADDVVIGAGEKLAVSGGLAIRAGGTATVSDLAATDLSITASQIEIRGRGPGPVALPGGGVVQDYGTDWVANNIATNVTPRWDGNGTRPTFVLGSGGIQMPGPIPFDVIRFSPGLDPIEASSFAGDGRQLDLTGTGSRAVSDASPDVPREAPPVHPFLEARTSDTPPTPPPNVLGDELLRTVRCRTAAGDACAPAIGDGMLASERTREIALRYHALVASDPGQQRLAEVFAPLASADLARSGSGSLDGRALYRALATTPGLAAARERVVELAVILAEVSLLGLDEPSTESVRRALAGDFAAATRVPGLDADAILDAVAASGVAVLP